MTHLLELPWEATRYFKSKYGELLRARGGSLYYYLAEPLPKELEPYATEDFTHARWLEDDERMKQKLRPLATRRGSVVFKPHPHQLEGAKAIFKHYFAGSPGFVLADKTGVGKTLTALTGVTAIAKQEGYTPQKKAKLLVVCPKGVIPVWRQTIHNYPAASSLLRVMVINYQQLHKLLKEDPALAAKERAAAAAARKAGKKVRTKSARVKNRELAGKGLPTVEWDYIIFDEAHYLKNFGSSATSLAAGSIARLDEPYRRGKTPYTIFATATPGSSPLNLAIMAKVIAPLLTASPSAKNVTPKKWGDFLIQQGFAVKKGKSSYTWATVPWFGKGSKDPKERLKYAKAEAQAKQVQRKDSLRIGKALTKPEAPFIMRSPKDIAGWPEQKFIPLPLELTPAQRPVYEEAWSRFRKWLRLTPAKSDPKGALVEALRYRQKTSLLKVDALVEAIQEFLEGENQVYVSLEFLETLDTLKKALEAKRIPVAEISGRTTATREEERLRFQRGEAPVVLCTVVAGISLHAGEILPDGTPATAKPRISILADIRQNPLDSIQAAGRAHRNGQASVLYLPFIEGTIDERVAASFANKEANQKAMTGSTLQEAEELERLFREAASEGGDE